MKRIVTCLFVLVLAGAGTRAQPTGAPDAELADRVAKLEGSVQDLMKAQLAEDKRIQDLAKEIDSLQYQLNQPNTNNYASQDGLHQLAQQVKELVKKEQADKELILKEIEKLGQVSSASASVAPPAANVTPAPAPGGKQTGYYYEVRSGNTLVAIARAYREKGVKVTVAQILKANPGLDPKNLKVGQKIFIPAPGP